MKLQYQCKYRLYKWMIKFMNKWWDREMSAGC